MSQAINARYRGLFEALHQFKRVCLLVLGILLFCAGGLMLVGALMIWRATSEWPRVESSILKLDIRPSGLQAARFQMDLEYRYTVGGQQFLGHDLSPTSSGDEVTARFADQKQRAFPVGQNVDVIYDPKNPARST